MSKSHYLSRPEIYLMLKVQQHRFPAEMTARLYSDLVDVSMAAISNTTIRTIINIIPFPFFYFFTLIIVMLRSEDNGMCTRTLGENHRVLVYCWINGLFFFQAHANACFLWHWEHASVSQPPLGKHKSERGIASSANAQLYWFAISVHLAGFLFFIFPKQILESWWLVLL